MKIQEGLSTIEIPDENLQKGPGTRRPGFYNQDQVLNRDITVAMISALGPRTYLDGFGGTGIRSIRVSAETGTECVVSEINRRSLEIIRDNVRSNDAGVEVIGEPFESVVARRYFDFIDVDPYGSVVPFADAALGHVKNGGYIGFTATDLSALTGSVRSKTYRRYGAFISNDRLKHEAGIRLLIGSIARRAAALDCEIQPQISLWRSHYYRVIVKVKHGAGIADRSLGLVRSFNKNDELSGIYPDRDEGPLWTGQLCEEKVLRKALENRIQGIQPGSYSFMDSLPDEDRRLFFYEMSDFSSHLKKSLPRIESMMDAIRDEAGAEAARTHFSNTGIKTGIAGDEFLRIYDRNSRA